MRRRRPTTPRIGALAFAAMVLGGALLGLSWVTGERAQHASVPVAPDLFGVLPVALAGGREACTGPVALGPGRVEPRFRAVGGPPGSPLELRLRPGGGGRVRAPGDGYVSAVLQGPRRPGAGAVCVRNLGSLTVTFAGTDQLRRATTRVDGRRSRGALELAMLERGEANVVSQAGLIARRVSAFRPPVVARGSVLLLLAATGLLLTGGLGLAWRASLSADRRSQAYGAAPGAPPGATTAAQARR